jgi:hypothetical protein
MKSLMNKIKDGAKKVGKTIDKAKVAAYTVATLGAFGAADYATGQEIDGVVYGGYEGPGPKTELKSTQAFDLSKQPIGYQRALNPMDRQFVHMLNGKDSLDYRNSDDPASHWKPNREEKIARLDKFFEEDETDKIQGEVGVFDCDEFSFTNEAYTRGIQNLDNYSELGFLDRNLNADWNIPLYTVSTVAKNGVFHRIVGAFVGPEDETQKENPKDFNQWVFYEPQNDQRVTPGHNSMDENRYAYVNAMVEGKSAIWGTTNLSEINIVGWTLNNGVGTIKDDQTSDYLVTERNDTPTAIHNPEAEKHKLKIFDQGGTVRVDYFADGHEKVIARITDMSGRTVRTIEDMVVPGSNTIEMSDAGLATGMHIVSVQDEDNSNVQSEKYVNLKK